MGRAIWTLPPAGGEGRVRGSSWMNLGLLPALGSGLGDLHGTGQASRLIDGYLRRYARVFDRVWYFSYLPETLGEFTDDAEVAACVRVLAPRRRRARLVRAVSMTAAHRREFRRCAVLRVFQVTGVIPALLARAWWGTPFVTTYGFWYARLSRPGPSRLGKRVLERLGLRLAAAVIATTDELRAHAARIAPSDRVHLIPNGVDLARFAPVARREKSIARVIYLGRLSEEKNLSALIQAVAALRARMPCHLTMIGSGPLRARLESEARSAGVSVEFSGVVDHRLVPDRLRDADAFVLPSFTEGHPKALIEAMAAGLPCVVSDCPGNRVLVKDGTTGLLFDPRDVSSLADRLARVLNDETLASALGRRAHELVASEYDLERLVETEIELLKRVAREGASKPIPRPSPPKGERAG
jgi:glycosyltransferase involved in cell wall biosynthesis